jgi:hypothetical protein
MIGFFRNIRQKLAAENKVAKYLRYAIGEILLVVIGILIALQINNWNENRKDSILELKILKGLHIDLEKNMKDVRAMISDDSLINVKNKILLEILNDKNSHYNDSMKIYFGSINRYWIFFPQSIAYETLKSKGLTTIKNDTLRSKIVELYEVTYFKMSHQLELKKDLYINSNNLINKRLRTLENINEKVPVDFKKLKTDDEFINTVSHFFAEQENYLGHSKSILSATVAVNNDVQKEIIRLEE